MEPAGDCCRAIAPRATELLKAGVDPKALTDKQRKYVAPVRTDLVNFHQIVTPSDMSLGMQRSEAHSSKTFRQYMAKWGPEHKEPVAMARAGTSAARARKTNVPAGQRWRCGWRRSTPAST